MRAGVPRAQRPGSQPVGAALHVLRSRFAGRTGFQPGSRTLLHGGIAAVGSHAIQDPGGRAASPLRTALHRPPGPVAVAVGVARPGCFENLRNHTLFACDRVFPRRAPGFGSILRTRDLSAQRSLGSSMRPLEMRLGNCAAPWLARPGPCQWRHLRRLEPLSLPCANQGKSGSTPLLERALAVFLQPGSHSCRTGQCAFRHGETVQYCSDAAPSDMPWHKSVIVRLGGKRLCATLAARLSRPDEHPRTDRSLFRPAVALSAHHVRIDRGAPWPHGDPARHNIYGMPN